MSRIIKASRRITDSVMNNVMKYIGTHVVGNVIG